MDIEARASSYSDEERLASRQWPKSDEQKSKADRKDGLANEWNLCDLGLHQHSNCDTLNDHQTRSQNASKLN